MANTQNNPRLGIQRKTAELRPEPKFVPWGKQFFAYLVKEKSSTNTGLLELVYCLSDDGRQELALSIFSFLRVQVWKDFCQDRRIAKCRAKKSVSKAISDLRIARTEYSALLASVPEIALYRQLGDDRRLHFSDILEQEATFLSGQARIERAKTRSRCCVRELCRPEQTSPTETMALLLRASRKLTRAADSYRRLLALTSDGAIGKAFDSFPASQLVDKFETEAAYLREVASRVNGAFNKKRLGSANLALLIRLQYFVQAFGLRWKPYLPPHTTTILRESDIGDLLEAGKAALGLPEDSTFTNAESIGRAVERFRQHKDNQRTCHRLRSDAQRVCDGLKIRPPSPQVPSKVGSQISTV